MFAWALLVPLLLVRFEVVRWGDMSHYLFRTHTTAWFFVVGWLMYRSTSITHRIAVSLLIVATVPGFFAGADRVVYVITALLADLEQRGLLDETLVVWAGEFGRLPIVQKGGTGRDHNPHAFTAWLAGGGVRGGTHHGATDDVGFKAVQDRVSVHDFHATLLHLLGLNHEQLTFRYSGRDFRLTDVSGEVVKSVLA